MTRRRGDRVQSDGVAHEQGQGEVREPCGDLGKGTDGGGNGHCKGQRTGARLVHSRM